MPPEPDDDLIYKQLVAVVDGRTTVICLDAAGQVRRIMEPFDTLVGRRQTPPFHIHCRSVVVPWMEGMGERLRTTARKELLKRPVAQRLQAAGRRPIPENFAIPDDKGLPSSLRADGDRDLGSIRSSHLKWYIEAHPDRFEITEVGDSSLLVTERGTHRQWIMKRVTPDEAVAVMVDSTVRENHDQESGPVLLGPREDGSSHGWFWLLVAVIVLKSGESATAAPVAEDFVGFEDKNILDLLLLDYLTDQTGRYSSNTMVVTQRKTQRIAVHDGSWAFSGGGGKLRTRSGIGTLERYLKGDGTPLGMYLAVRAQGRKSPQAVMRRYDKFVQQAVDGLEDAQSAIRGVARKYPPGTRGREAALSARLLYRSRVEALVDNRDENVAYLTGQRP